MPVVLAGKGFILKVHPEGFILNPPMADEGIQGIGNNKQPDANRTLLMVYYKHWLVLKYAIK